ncbi:Rieske 2Fe-2S domain-containing protein [Streptomyces atratus]|uniref:aromatic ring-hydroxylating oxygenase subunit alpha n=1 Tax=Streptomyces atratus TaxID=1893 RepID=UPI0016712C89|nr:Rieske 2Fe-2S domain-containing protein [Streptomyces atratus]WPW26317.1 Rieske 2Fe-2S domain-containing protein [Streptomyces atratus]GGT65916.1 3-phenylpropionate/cinnamic acid dioxygenase subunit alpha [Streptomyces atratus]
MTTRELRDAAGLIVADILDLFSPDFGRVPQAVMNHPAVLDAELERIFTTAWLFVGHESEIAEPGDYITRRMGRDQVIVTRDEQGEVRVLRNACSHRGTLLCKATSGNTSHFMCPYHAWTFDNTGRLRGAPEARKAYGPGFDRADHPLKQARVGVHQGLVFATWDPEAPPLAEFLGDIAWYLDMLLGTASGGWEVAGPPQRYLTSGNWKISCENFGGDGYHLPYTHRTPIEAGLFGEDDDDGSGGKPHGRVVWTPQGHTARIGYMPPEVGGPPYWGMSDGLRADFVANATPEMLQVLDNADVVHGNLFPNLSFIFTAITYTGDEPDNTSFLIFRMAMPVDAETTEMVNILLVPRDATPEWKQRSVLACVRTHGAAAVLFEGDDFDNFASVSATGRGVVAQGSTLDYSMGLGLPVEPDDWPGPGESAPHDHSERTHRAFYGAWLRAMKGEKP